MHTRESSVIRETVVEKHHVHPVYIDRPVFIDRPVYIDRPIPLAIPQANVQPIQVNVQMPAVSVQVPLQMNLHAPQQALHLHGAAPQKDRTLAIEQRPPIPRITWREEQPPKEDQQHAIILLPAPPQPVDPQLPSQVNTEVAKEDMLMPRASQLGKRRLESADDIASQDQSQSSASSARHTRKRRFTRVSEWPPEWQAQYSAWKAQVDMAERHKLWLTWEKPLQDQVWSATTTAMRSEIKEWMAEAEGAFSQGSTSSRRPKARGGKKPQSPSTPEAQPPFLFENKEKQSHDWQEGARMGEATHPGPRPGRNRSSKAPPNPKTRPQPQNQNARESAKGYNPGPTRPRGQERREPGQVEEAQQAPPHGWAHRNQQTHAPRNINISGREPHVLQPT